MAEIPPADEHVQPGIEMPRPTAAPLILALGISLLAVGWATNVTFVVVGALLFVTGLGSWISHLLPGQGHEIEPLVAPSLRSRPVVPVVGTVDRLQRGMPGYRLRLPIKMHPISAGLKGGILGGIVMPIPAMIYGLASGHGVWLPINLLAGLVLPGVDQLSLEELDQFDPTLLTVGAVIHATVAVTFGLLYGVLLPALPPISRPLAWGALLMPLLWTAVSYLATSAVDPTVRQLIDWPYFVLSQFIFGVVLASVTMFFDARRLVLGGLIGGAVGGLLMTIPAMLWGYFSGHGVWYPVNLLVVMVLPQGDALTVSDIEQFHSNWFIAATLVHATVSLTFGLLFGLLLTRLPKIPAPFAWGAMMMPLLWTATSYSMMGVVNPALQHRVDWPWFVISQFVYGLAVAVVVVRSEQIAIAPAGQQTKGAT